jgi:hypothetical protein
MQLRRRLKGDKEVGGGNQQKKPRHHEYLAVLREMEAVLKAPTCKLAEVVSGPEPSIAKKFENLGLTASTAVAKSLKSWEHDGTV